jgi:hypothetical protein
MFRICTLAIVILVFTGCACAAKHGPVLYPNEQFLKAGEVQAQKDIDECSRMADTYVKQNPGAKIAENTILGGAFGAAVGAAGGAVTGNLGTGSTIGAPPRGRRPGSSRELYKARSPVPFTSPS